MPRRDLPLMGTSLGLTVRIWRRKWWFIGVTFGSMSGAVAVLMSIPVHYVARGAVIVSEIDGQARPADAVDIESQVALIRSPRLVRAVLGRAGVLDAVRQDCIRGTPLLLRVTGLGTGCGGDIDDAVDRVTDRYVVTPVGASRVINVGYNAATPEMAQGMANFLIRTFLDEPKPTVAADREQAVTRLRQDMATLELAVKDDEGRLAAAHRAIAARNATPDRQIAAGTMAEQRAMAEAALKVKPVQRGIGGLPDVRVGLDTRPVESIHGDLEAIDDRILAEPAGSPLLRSLRAQREQLRLQIGRSDIPGYRTASRAYLASAEPATTRLQMVEDVRQEAPAEPVLEPATIERMLDLKRQLYVDAYRRASALAAEPLPVVPVNKLVNLAEEPTQPRGRMVPYWFASLVGSLCLGTIAALVRDRSDKTVRSAAAVEGARDVTVLTQIPLVSLSGAKGGRKGGADPQLRLHDMLAAARETILVQDALRALLARLVMAGPTGARRRVFMIMSAAPREGKSFTTLALAQLIASSNRKVLAVECDLRRPTFAAALNLTTGPGLGDVLRGFVPPREAVARTAFHTLDVIPAGVPCIDSTELLMGSRIADLLAWATEYDFVLLDTPPSDMLMDARVLAKLVDGIVICTRWGRSKLGDLGATVDGVRASGGTVCGVAVTMVEPRQHGLFDSRPVPTCAYIADV